MKLLPELRSDTVITRAARAQTAKVDGTLLIAAREGGPGHCLDPVGTAIWGYLAEPRSLGDLCDLLGQKFQVEPDVCVRDTTEFIREMLARDLLRIV